MPLTMNGSDAGKMTLNQVCRPFEPIVRAARAIIGGTLRTPLSVAMITDQSVPMMTTKSIAVSVCPNPEERQRSPADARQRLQAKCKHPDCVFTKLEPGRQQPQRQASRNADDVASQKATHRDHRRLQKRAIFGSTLKILPNADRIRQQHGRPDFRQHQEMPDRKQSDEKQR